MPELRRSLNQQGGWYRYVDDLSIPWVASPIRSPSPPPTPPAIPAVPVFTSLKEYSVKSDFGASYHVQKDSCPGFWQYLWIWLARMVSFRRNFDHHPPHQTSSKPKPTLDRVLPHEWKAWGYYARPIVNGVEVENSPSTPSKPLNHINMQNIFDELLSPDGSKHPERWVPGAQHPALPPRPSRWKIPDPMEPLPFPWECQLNPYLVHYNIGPAPLCWDIGVSPVFSIMHGAVGHVTIPLFGADKAQPATYPFLTHMYVNAVADDSAPKFPWPFMVHNPRGIRVEDIFEAIFNNFQEFVSKEEYEGWHSVRRQQAVAAYYDRHRLLGVLYPLEGLRRVDYLSHRVMFRGLEPNPNGEGWMMFVGLA